ncbi:MAG: hypothetical protein JOZ69_25345 [Myxococcales bacterium]|nr:hypothetical protein [Myxococcales bacterium]
MNRSASLLLVGSFLTCSRLAMAAGPVVSITSPLPNAAVGDAVAVACSVQSTFTLSTPTAQLTGGAVQPLTVSSAGFSGTLDASSLPIGPLTLTVNVTDSVSQTGSATVSLVHDHPPVLTVGTPDGVLGRPDVRLQAQCADADMYGCASLSVSIGAAVLASTTDPVLDTTVSLVAYAGQAVTLTFTATDTQGMTTSLTRSAYVDTNPTLTEVAVGDGPILDFDATRILFAKDTNLVLRPRSGGADMTLATGIVRGNFVGDPYLTSHAYLTSHGAIWAGGELRDDTISANAITPDGNSELAAKGDYAAWLLAGDAGATFYWRNIATDSTSALASNLNLANNDLQIAANGDAVFSIVVFNSASSVDQQKVILSRDGGAPLVIPSAFPRFIGGQTDGVNVIYQQFLAGGTYGGTALYSSGTEIQLPACASLQPGIYAVSGGWTAFESCASVTAPRVVYTRSPGGTIAQASVFNADTVLDALDDTGTVVYHANGSRYVGAAGGGVPATFSDNTLGRVVALDGHWYEVVGQALLLYAPTDAGAGVGGSLEDGASVPGDSGSGDGGASSSSDASSQASDGQSTASDASPQADGQGAVSDASSQSADAGSRGMSGSDATIDAGMNPDAGAGTGTTDGPADHPSGSSGGGGCAAGGRRSNTGAGIAMLMAIACGSLVRRRTRLRAR